MQSQTWIINGRHYNREQVAEYKRDLANKFHKDAVVKVVKVKEVKKVEEKKPKDLPLVSLSDLKKEFQELKDKKAWLYPETKVRYNELKGMFLK